MLQQNGHVEVEGLDLDIEAGYFLCLLLCLTGNCEFNPSNDAFFGFVPCFEEGVDEELT